MLLGKGDGTFFGPLVFGLGGSAISQTFVADVNGDGTPDLLSSNWGGGKSGDGAVGVLLNNPDFVFNNTTTTLTSSRDPSGPNKAVTYTAVIHPQLGGTASGSVWLLDNGILAGGGQLANNQATCRELQEVMLKAKQMASRIKEASDLRELEQYLTRRRKEIDRKCEPRSSHLTQVFGRLLHEGRIREEELRGLREDKLASIRSCARFLDESDAAYSSSL